MKRIFHRYEKWEEYHHGMWRIVKGDDRALYRLAAAFLMKTPAEFLEAMTTAIDYWPISCENSLTSRAVNRRAWFGHAGCCIAVGSPEDITREAWHTLTQNEQNEANHAADLAIEQWEATYAEAQARSKCA